MLKQSDAGQLQEIIESPLIDSVDQQLLVSALTLSGLRLFDMRKFRLLAHVYLHSTVMEVKQRALVGWVLMLGWMRHNDYPEIGDIVSSLTGDEQTKTDLVNLQLQLLTTVDAESAGKNFSKTIKEEMPNLSSFSVEDIESTDDLDRIMSENDSILQQYAEAINLQKDMRQKGNDIYFDGFKNMKKFPFFNDVCNWFMPFITTHPALRSVNNRDMMRFFKVSGSLCDNDMYSLSIAMNSCVSQMPPAISEAMKQHTGDVKPTESPNEQIRKILYMRNYIESMYRFFRLFRYRDSFRPHRPFPDSSLAEVHQCEDIPELLFMANPVFSRKECVGMMLDTVRLLIRKKCYPLANDAFVRIPYDDKYLDNKVYITTLAKLTILGQPAAMLLGLNELDILRKASLMYPESKVICKALALLLQQTHHYEEAEKYFDRLAAHDKDAVDWPLEKARCLINRKEYTKALDTLFKIRYEHEDEQTVIPLIADCKIRLGERMEAFGFLQTAIDQGNADDTTKRIYIACACVNAIKGEQGIPMDKVLEITLEYLRSSYSSEELLDFDNFPEIMETDFIRYVREAMNFDDSQPTTSIEVFMCMLSNEVWNVLD